MRVSFLGQGFTNSSPNSVGSKLTNLFSRNFNTFFGMSAFASAAGVRGLLEYINDAKTRYDEINLIVGIDQNGTSKEALEEIINLGINAYIFYQKEAPIFHPKLYLFEGDNETVLILGSSNLTSKGLFNNVESSLMIEFDNGDIEGERVINELKVYYHSLFDFSDPNLFEITSANISNFINDGIVSPESTRIQYQGKKKPSGTSASTIPTRNVSSIPSEFRIPRRSRSATSPEKIINTTSSGNEESIERRDLVWTKESLSRSDAQMVPAGSNPTGNLKLSQAGFHNGGDLIDQTSYFRNFVFNHLIWNHPKPANTNFEESFIQVYFTILGRTYRPTDIRLSHDIGRIAGQANTPTWLHWGPEMTPIISSLHLNGRRLDLFKTDIPDHFIIEIQ